jgi:type IV pilus assembly protein PilQ
VFFIASQVFFISSCATTGGGTGVSKTPPSTTVSIDSVTELQDRYVILLKSATLINYTPYRLDSPSRLVVDVIDATFLESGEDIIIGGETISEVRMMDLVSDGTAVARMEIHLATETNYFISKPQENQIKVEVQKSPGTYTASPPVTETPVVPEEEVWDVPATRIINIVTESDYKGTSVAVVADGSVENYESFVLDDPYRLVVDVKGLTSNFPKNELSVDGDDVSAIRIGIHPDKVRLVFESAVTTGISKYSVYAKENKLMVVFREGENLKFESDTSSPTPSTPASGETVTVNDVTFRDLSDVARVIISTSGTADYNAKMISDRSVIVDIDNAVAGAGVEKKLDVSSFGGPITSISTYRTEDAGTKSIRVIVELDKKVAYTYFAEGSDIFVDFAKTEGVSLGSDMGSIPTDTSIGEGLAQPATLPGESISSDESIVVPPMTEEEAITLAEIEEAPKYTGKKITLIFTDADIRNIFQLIAEVSNLNILVDSNVRGRITLRLVKVPWDQALDIILTTTNLGMERVGNVIRIATRETLDRERTTELASKRALEELEDLVTRKIDLSYADIDEVRTVVVPMLSDRGEITIFSQTKSLLITDIPSRLTPITEIIRTLDIPVREIRLEARIVEVNDTFEQELGVNWAFGYNEPVGSDSYKTSIGTLESTLLNIPNYFDTSSMYFPVVPEAGTIGTGGASVLLGLADDTVHLEVQLKALEQMGEAEIIESPKIRVLDNVTAIFTLNRKIPIRNTKEEIDDEGNVTIKSEIDFQEFETMLEITPSISADKRIRLELYLYHKREGDPVTLNIDGIDNVYYIEDEKELDTQVLVDNRDTIVIGGLYRKDIGNVETGVPLLREIPVLGWLFKTKATSEERRELLIFITPTIIRENEGVTAEAEF